MCGKVEKHNQNVYLACMCSCILFFFGKLAVDAIAITVQIVNINI